MALKEKITRLAAMLDEMIEVMDDVILDPASDDIAKLGTLSDDLSTAHDTAREILKAL